MRFPSFYLLFLFVLLCSSSCQAAGLNQPYNYAPFEANFLFFQETPYSFFLDSSNLLLNLSVFNKLNTTSTFSFVFAITSANQSIFQDNVSLTLLPNETTVREYSIGLPVGEYGLFMGDILIENYTFYNMYDYSAFVVNSSKGSLSSNLNMLDASFEMDEYGNLKSQLVVSGSLSVPKEYSAGALSLLLPIALPIGEYPRDIRVVNPQFPNKTFYEVYSFTTPRCDGQFNYNPSVNALTICEERQMSDLTHFSFKILTDFYPNQSNVDINNEIIFRRISWSITNVNYSRPASIGISVVGNQNVLFSTDKPSNSNCHSLSNGQYCSIVGPNDIATNIVEVSLNLSAFNKQKYTEKSKFNAVRQEKDRDYTTQSLVVFLIMLGFSLVILYLRCCAGKRENTKMLLLVLQLLPAALFSALFAQLPNFGSDTLYLSWQVFIPLGLSLVMLALGIILATVSLKDVQNFFQTLFQKRVSKKTKHPHEKSSKKRAKKTRKK